MGFLDFFNQKGMKDKSKIDSEKGRAAQNLLSRDSDQEHSSSYKPTSAGTEKSFIPKDRHPAQAPSHKYYEVQEGDSLSGIAKEHYGDSSRWKRIYEKNKEIIEDPDDIQPGQMLELPDFNEQDRE